ncbi:hypothetical protein AKJ45_03245, partial [candidate division MSBL1 archaeon SCGC-AAA261F19]
LFIGASSWNKLLSYSKEVSRNNKISCIDLFLDYDVKIAKLSEKDLKKVKDLEEKLGVSLVAVEK